MIDPQVTVLHIRECKLCVKGARAWFDKHNLDFRTFIQHGYPASVIAGTNDALGVMVADKAREMHRQK